MVLGAVLAAFCGERGRCVAVAVFTAGRLSRCSRISARYGSDSILTAALCCLAFTRSPALADGLLCQLSAAVQRGLSGLDNGIPGGAFHLFLQPVGLGVWTVLPVGLLR